MDFDNSAVRWDDGVAENLAMEDKPEVLHTGKEEGDSVGSPILLAPSVSWDGETVLSTRGSRGRLYTLFLYSANRKSTPFRRATRTRGFATDPVSDVLEAGALRINVTKGMVESPGVNCSWPC